VEISGTGVEVDNFLKSQMAELQGTEKRVTFRFVPDDAQ